MHSATRGIINWLKYAKTWHVVKPILDCQARPFPMTSTARVLRELTGAIRQNMLDDKQMARASVRLEPRQER